MTRSLFTSRAANSVVAVPLVVVRHGRGPSLLKREAWLCAIERLDLALLVDAEHNRSFRRIEVKPDNIGDFLLELRVIRDLEALDEMRLQAGLRPDAPDTRRADAYRLGHRRTAPVRRIGRLLGGRLGQNGKFHCVAQRGDARGPCLVA